MTVEINIALICDGSPNCDQAEDEEHPLCQSKCLCVYVCVCVCARVCVLEFTTRLQFYISSALYTRLLARDAPIEIAIGCCGNGEEFARIIGKFLCP